jgi:hypothetical protein
MEQAAQTLEHASAAIDEWEESIIRQLVDTVKVVSAEQITVCLRGGVEIEQQVRTEK